MATFGNQGGGFNAGTNWGTGAPRPVYAPQQQSRTSAPVAMQKQQLIQPTQQDGSIDYSALLGALPLVNQLVSGAFSDQNSIADVLSGNDGRYLSPQAEGLLSMAASQAGKYSGLDPHIGGFIPAAVSLLNNNPEGALRQAAGTGAGMLASELLPGAARGLAGPLATLASGLVGGDTQGKLIENVGNSAIGALPGLLGVTNPLVGLAYGAARMLGMNPMQAIGEYADGRGFKDSGALTDTDSLRAMMYPDLRQGMEGGLFGKQGVGEGVSVPDNFEIGVSGPLMDESGYSPSINLDRLDTPGLKLGSDAFGRSGINVKPASSYESMNINPSDFSGDTLQSKGEGSFGGSLRDVFGPIKTASDELSGSFGVDAPDYNPYGEFSQFGSYNQRGEFNPVGTKAFDDLNNPELNAYAGFYDQYAGNANYDTPDYLAYNPGTSAVYSPEYKSMFSADQLAALGQAGFENPYGTLLQNYGWEQTAPATSGYYEGHEGQTWVPESSSWGTTAPGYWIDTDNYNLMQNGHYQWESQDAMRSGAAPISQWNPETGQTSYFNNGDIGGPSVYDTELPYYAAPPVQQIDYGNIPPPVDANLDYGMYQPSYGADDYNSNYNWGIF